MTPLSFVDAGLTSNACFSSNSCAFEDDEDVNDANYEAMESICHEEDVEDAHAIQFLFLSF